MADADEEYNRVLEHLHVVNAEIDYLWRSVAPAQVMDDDERIRLAEQLVEACKEKKELSDSLSRLSPS